MAQEQPTPQPWYERALTIDYFAVSRTFWTNLLETVRFYITKLADELVEIVSRGIMLMTPMPNAISMYKTAMKQLGWSWYEALPFSLMIEFIVFFLIEIALLMLTRWLAGRGNVYRWMFGVMVTVVIFGTGGVMWLVNQLEPHKIMTILPAFSLLGFIAIGLRRWDARNEEVLAEKSVKRTVKPSVNFTVPSVNHSVKPTVKEVTPRQEQILQWLEKYQGQPAESFVKADLMRDIKISRPTLLDDLRALQDAGELSINGTINVTRKGRIG